MSSLSTAPVPVGDSSALTDAGVLGQPALGAQGAVLSSALLVPAADPTGSPASAVGDAGASATPVDAGLTAASVLGKGLELLDEGAKIELLVHVLETYVGLLGVKIAVPVLKGILRDPDVWSDSVQEGMGKELISLITGPVDLFLAVAEFTGRATACIVFRAGLGWAELQSSDVIGPEVLIDAERDLCKPYEDFKDQLTRLEALGDEMLTTLGDMLEHPIDATLEVLELAVLVFAELNDVMDEDGPLRTRVLHVLQDPKQSGEFTGRLLFNVLLFFVPGADEADAVAQVGRGLSLAARRAEAEAKLARLGLAAEETELPAEFLELLEEVRAAMRKSRIRMSESVKDKKFQVVRKVSQLSDLTEGLLLLSRERIYTALVQKRGTVGAIRDLAGVVDDFNAHSKLVFLLELERQGATSVATADVALGGMTQAEQLLDRAHLVDARFFDRFSAEARAELGWTSDADMPGVIATASEHRRSWPSYFKKLDTSAGAALPADLRELGSVTPYFRQRIIKADATGAALPGELTPVTGATFLGPDAKASAIVKAHLEVWQEQRFSMAGGLASKGVIPELQRILGVLVAKGL